MPTPSTTASFPDCVVLFDIDGTLVRGPSGKPSAGLLSMNRAAFIVTRSSIVGEMRDLEGLSDMEIASRFRIGDPADFAGRTDPQIARRLIEFVEKKPASDERIRALVDHYVEGLPMFIEDHPYAVLGDPRGAVEELLSLGAVVGLGTGNVPAGARIKLDSCGIGDLFDISLGGYGDDGETRADLIAEGARRCDPGGTRRVVVVGDTPRDVEAAHATGALCIGVPFHRNTREVLLDCGADAVVDAVGPGLAQVITDLYNP